MVRLHSYTMKILTFTTLYPNQAQPNHGVFVENRLRHLVLSQQVEVRVVAPVPWFPFKHARFGKYATFARVPRAEERHGISILHPRFPQIPKVGMSMSPFLLAAAVRPVLQRMIDEGYDFDVIDAHYFYPDGVAAALLARHFKKRLVITARGSDISVLPEFFVPGKLIRWAAARASGLITVCQALKDAMVDLGISPERIVPLRNGVDLKLFRIIDRDARRRELGLTGFTLLSVGLLAEHKGHCLIIEALPSMPGVRLLIAGTGPDREALERLAEQLGVRERVTFLGAVPHAELPQYYGAVDALVLASSREGWANVLLESMACGTPVVASRVWGTPEVVAAAAAGVLMHERSANGIAQAVSALREDYPAHEATRHYAEGFSWDDTTNGQLTLFRRLLQGTQG
jgi:teichuronic acid biosynthesis glycosyltransferase TuaC